MTSDKVTPAQMSPAKVTPEECEACGGRMRARKRWLWRCERCGFLASTLAPGAGLGVDGLEPLRRRNYETILDRIDKAIPLSGARLLEVGSAHGWFLEAAQRRGARAHAIEPVAANAAAAAERLGLAIETGFFPDDLTDRGPYDLIIFNDVFEHIPQPSQAIREVAALLRPGGIVALNLPSSGGALYRIASALDRIGIASPLDRLWQKGFASPHVSYFNRGSLKRLVEARARLKMIDWFAVESVSRDGLSARIRGSHPGVFGLAMVAGVWTLSHALPLLPPDIQVGLFRAESA